MIVLTPQGIVVHTIVQRQARFNDILLPFAVVRDLQMQRTYANLTQLHCTLHDGRFVDFTIPTYFPNIPSIAEKIRTAWQASQPV